MLLRDQFMVKFMYSLYQEHDQNQDSNLQDQQLKIKTQ